MSSPKAASIRYINQLRILAIYTVVAAHIAIWTAQRYQPLSFEWWLCNWIHILAIWTVPVFVMVSGALLLENPKNEPAGAFYKKRLSRIGIPVVFWTIVYILARKYINHEPLSIRHVSRLILTANPYYHLWFLYMIPGLYLVTPPLRSFIRQCSQTRRIAVIVLILLAAAIYYYLNTFYWHYPRLIFTMFIPYIAYYLCGYELRHIDPKRIPAWVVLLAIAVCALYVAIIAGPFIDHQGYVGDVYIIDFLSPPVILMGVVIFMAAYNIDQRGKHKDGLLKKAEAWVASATLGIYVLHPLVLEYMRDNLSRRAAEKNIFVGLTVGPIIAFAASYIITSLMMNVPFLRRTVG